MLVIDPNKKTNIIILYACFHILQKLQQQHIPHRHKALPLLINITLQLMLIIAHYKLDAIHNCKLQKEFFWIAM